MRSLVEEPGRSLWIGTANGVANLVNGQVAAKYGIAQGLPSADIRSLFRDRDGVLWAGTASGLASFSGGRFHEHPGAPRQPIRCIGQDRDGKILIGIDEGIYSAGKNGFTQITQNGIYLRNPNAFLLDPEGLLWVALNGGGLRMIDGQKVYQFITRDGLYDAEVLGLTIDGGDRMWMACSRGIFWISRSDLRKFAEGELSHLTSVAYSPTESQRVIEGRQGVHPSLWRMRDGHVWLSTARGVISVDPAQPSRETPPPVVIERPIVNGVPTSPDRISQLPGGQKNILFSFAGLSYFMPDQIHYRYRLEGFDKDWVDAGTRRDAIYTNLPPGDYRFQVTACNYDGPCNQQGAVISFALAPLFYQHAWFWPLMLALAAIFGWGGYQLHIRRLRERYDLIVSERNRIARELHDTLIQGFSGITMALQALTTRIRTPEERDTLNDIIHDAATCLRETRQSVAGLRAVPGPHSGLSAAVERAVREITETKHVRARLNLETVTRTFAPEVEYNLLRILREAVNNAVKHSGADTIDITLRNRPDALTLTIRDDGSGFDRDHAGPGPGHYGLIGMKERASQIGATLDVDSEPGAGTTISVILPASVPAGRALELST
ncbi:MAG: triple tyrosine motif-containing protein [Acidobacteriota bacterium]